MADEAAAVTPDSQDVSTRAGVPGRSADGGPDVRAADWLGLGAAMVSVVLWASAFVGIRAIAADVSPGGLAFGRLLIGSLLLGVVVLLRPWRTPGKRDLFLIALCGVLWFGIYNIALNAGSRIVDAGTAAMLVNVGPILIAVFAGLFLGEGFPSRLVAGSVTAFAGALIIGLATTTGIGPGAEWGILLCLVAAFGYAAGVALQKPALRRVPALTVTWMACSVGAFITLPFVSELIEDLARAPQDALVWLIYLGVFPTAVAFTTWSFALSRTSAGRLGTTTYMVPPVAILIAWVVLAELPPLLAMLGGAVCLAGVAIARSRPSAAVGRGQPA